MADYNGMKKLAKELGVKGYVGKKAEKLMDMILDFIEEKMDQEGWPEENQEAMAFYNENTESEGAAEEEDLDEVAEAEEAETEDEEEYLDEVEEKVKTAKAEKEKQKKEKKKEGATKNNKKKQGGKPGVIATIVSILSSTKKGFTVEEITERLAKAFPERDAEGMSKTTKVQVGGRIQKEKGLNVVKEGKKYMIK